MKKKIQRLLQTFQRSHFEDQEEYYAFVNYNKEFIDRYAQHTATEPTGNQE